MCTLKAFISLSIYSYQSFSCPFVIVLRSFDALEFPEILHVEVLGFGVSSAETLRNPGIVDTLSVTESYVTNPATNSGSEEKTREGEGNVSIEGYGVKTSLGGEIPVAEGSAKEGRS